MKKKHRIGILGGTFNPIHIGHLSMAEYAKKEFDLEQVLFIPVGNPPHKDLSHGVADQDRVKMTELAIQKHPSFAVHLFEIHKKGICYTFETLQYLSECYPDTEFYFILGADSLFYFDTWCHPEKICQYSTILVAVRDDKNRKDILDKIAELEQKYQTQMYPLKMPQISISSTEIRNRIRQGRSIRCLVPDTVEQYIYQQHLYV